MSDAPKQYLRSAVMTATPEQLQLMLFDGAIKYATRGLDAIKARDLEATFNALDRAQQIVLQLQAGLRRDVNPQLVDQMSALYDFIYRRLVDANMKRDTQAVEDALRILRHQRETWVLLMGKINREARADRPAGPPPQPEAESDAAVTFVAEA